MTTPKYPTAQLNQKSRFSLIWIIPLTAALIGGWIVYKYYSERGTLITIILNEAAGVEAKKTPIRYKSVQVGRVKKISLTSDLQKVKVIAEIYPEMASNLTSNTRFWVEKPRISFQGVSGLDTLLSGVHIGMDPGGKINDEDNYPLDTYIGLGNPPVVTGDEKGTTLTLNAKDLGSLDVGSPVYYRKIKVGKVINHSLNSSDETVNISIHIDSPYDKKIKTNSRFWNAGGLEAQLTAGGVVVRMESLLSLLIGGIAFDTPFNEVGYPVNSTIGSETNFKLYETYKLADDDTQRFNKLFYVMYFDDTLHGLSKDSVIEYNGVKVGKVESILLEGSKNLSQVKTLVKISFRIDKFSIAGNRKEAEQVLQALVQSGLHAQLTVDSLITGSQYIALTRSESTSPKKKDMQIDVLLPTTEKHSAIFPTTGAQQTLLNFDASKISQELNKTLSSITALVSSNDIKAILAGLATTSKSIGKITQQLDRKGFSGELVQTLNAAKKATLDIRRLIQDSRKLIQDSRHTVVTIGNATNKLQESASQTLRTVDNIGNKLQHDLHRTLNGVDRVTLTLNKGLKTTLSEDSALQYRLQQLINNLSEASNSFSVLADTLQRKPNSIIFGK